MSEVPGFDHHNEVITSQRSTDFILQAVGLSLETLSQERVLDLGSGYQQQVARDIEAAGGFAISLDPNLPHNDEYVWQQVNNDIRTDLRLNYGDMIGTDELLVMRSEILRDLKAVPGYINDYKQTQGWPDKPYGKAVAGVVSKLPFADGTFGRIIATTSVPYALSREEVPIMLAEANRVLKKGGKAHFWPLVQGEMNNELRLDDIRSLVQKARRVSDKAGRKALTGFGLEVYENPNQLWQGAMRAASSYTNSIAHTKTLVLTRKV